MQKREADPDGWYRFGYEKSLYLKSVKQLADFVGANPDNLVLVENASTGKSFEQIVCYSFFICRLLKLEILF